MRGPSHTASERHWRLLCLGAALLPLCVTHLSLAFAVSAGELASCNPYGPDCVSISRAGRQPASILFFKSLMLPYVLVVTALWMALARRLSGILAGPSRRLGIVAAVFLGVYVLALGVKGDEWQLARKIGVVLAFTLTYLAQLYLLRDLRRGEAYRQRMPAGLFRAQEALLLLMLAIGMASVGMDLLMHDYDRVENAVEWWLALMLYGFFASLAGLPDGK